MINSDSGHKVCLSMNKFTKKIWFMIITLFIVAIYFPLFLIYIYFFSESEGAYMIVFKYVCMVSEPTENQIKVIEEEFGFVTPPDWEITDFEIRCDIMRGLRNSVRIEGVIDNIDDIREFFQYPLSDGINIYINEHPLTYESYESYEIPKLYESIEFFRDAKDEDNFYQISIFKIGLNNRWLPFHFETQFDNGNYRIVKAFGEIWKKIITYRTGDG